MSTDDNKRIVRRFIDEIVNTGDVDRLAEFVSPDCVETDGKVRVVSGVEGMAEHLRAVRKTYANLHLTIERQIGEGDWVVTQITARGIHRGTWLGMKPTNRPIVMTGVNVDKVVGGLIVEHGGAVNMLDALLEVGAIQVVSE